MWSFVIRVVAVCVRAVVAAVIEAAADVLYRSIAADLNRRFGIAWDKREAAGVVALLPQRLSPILWRDVRVGGTWLGDVPVCFGSAETPAVSIADRIAEAHWAALLNEGAALPARAPCSRLLSFGTR